MKPHTGSENIFQGNKCYMPLVRDTKEFPILEGANATSPSPLRKLLRVQINQLFHSFYSPKPTFLHSKSCHKETFIFLAPQFCIFQVGQNLNLKTYVAIMGIFLNIGSKTNMAGHYADISGNWAAMSFSRLHKEQGTWEKGAHN